jgi:hypothetical protein
MTYDLRQRQAIAARFQERGQALGWDLTQAELLEAERVVSARLAYQTLAELLEHGRSAYQILDHPHGRRHPETLLWLVDALQAELTTCARCGKALEPVVDHVERAAIAEAFLHQGAGTGTAAEHQVLHGLATGRSAFAILGDAACLVGPATRAWLFDALRHEVLWCRGCGHGAGVKSA